MAEQTNTDFLREQQRAVARMIEMRDRAASGPSNHKMPPAPSFIRMPNQPRQIRTDNIEPPKEAERITEHIHNVPEVQNTGKSTFGFDASILERLKTEKDLPLILGLLLILWSENADRYLMLALLYIII